MEESAADDWSDWREQRNPYLTLNEKLSKEQREELQLFCELDKFRVEEEARRNIFELEMKRARSRFKKEEHHRRLDLMYPFGHRIWSEGIEEVRRKMVPAYTFVKFGALPLELQARIWSMAARFEDPKLRVIQHMQGTQVGSSLIDYDRWKFEPFPNILHVCRTSRVEVMKVYTQMSTSTSVYINSYINVKPYINTLYDSFYMGEKEWDQFKILIDLVVKENTTQPLRPAVQTDLDALLNIRFLMVDLNIFGAAPINLWANFPKLEKLSIIFYPFEETTVVVGEQLRNFTPEFVKPQRGSWHGKRAEWIVNLASKSIEKAKAEAVPDWKVPKLEALVRRTGTEIDFEIEDEFTDDEITVEYDNSDDERERNEVEENWRGQAAARMTHAQVPRDKIEAWKRKYLSPSYVPDSETEGRDGEVSSEDEGSVTE
ncbi:hypothetical protein N431DRAFT_421711 [Stipitochalara longipes BDJ]|nr:hypothetical protein N431DRAFT_421711 [Stipitochalara longipes BDJ]